MKGFFHKLPRNIICIFTFKNLIWHILAIALTYIIVNTGIDWAWFLLVRHDTINTILFPAVIIGAIIPIILPLCLLLIGKIRKNKSIYEGRRIMNAAYALGQAAILGSFISSIFKAFTGRIQPDLSNLVTDISNGFQFGFWEHGIFWGWPSSHTTIAFAMSFALIYLYPRNKIIKYTAFAYALYIGLGISIGIHWLSEFVAGAIIGTVIGIVVGKCFKEKGVK
jgi:membrane-associated phospholipid phosphatase